MDLNIRIASVLLVGCLGASRTHAQTTQPTPSGLPVTLQQVLAHAEQRAPALQVGRARASLGDAEVEAASPLLPDDPEVRLALGPRLTAEGRTLDIEVALEQRLQIGGERRLRRRAAERTRERSRAELDELRWEVHRRVHAAFHSALVDRERLRAAELELAFAERLVTIARKREAAGAISGLQADLAVGELAQARQAKVAAASTYRTARLLLAELAGYGTAKLPEPSGGLELPAQIPAEESLVRAAFRAHPELRSRLAAVHEAEAQQALAAREVLPKPVLGVTYAQEAEAGGVRDHVVLGTLSFALPVWQRNLPARARAAAQTRHARAQHESARAFLRSRVARAREALRSAAERVRIYGTEVVPTFRGNLDKLERAFVEGKADVLQVMVARGRFLETQRAALAAHEDYFRAHARLEAVVGLDLEAGLNRGGAR